MRTIKIDPSIGSNGIGIITSSSHVDHIVALAHLTKLPVLVFDREIEALIEHYYPPIELKCYETSNGCIDKPLAGYDFFLHSEPARFATGNFLFQYYYCTHSHARSIFTHHGNSDKSFHSYWFEKLIDEDILLVYGDHMRDHFEAIGFDKPMQTCGNYRLAYYKAHHSFFQKKVAPYLFEENKRRTILYAPTWSASNMETCWRFDYSVVHKTHHWLLDEIPDNYQVLVKLHPNYLKRMSDEAQEMIETYQHHPQIRFIHNLPLIYPLLEHVDLFVGDFSSVGFDFLYFDRPMFFFSDNRERDLFKCGVVLRENQFWKKVEDDQTHLSETRRKMYDYAYGDKVCTSIS